MSRALRAYTWILVMLLYLPLALTIVYSFSASRFLGEWGGFTTRWYRLMLEDPELVEAARNSLVIAASSAAASVALALPVALYASGRSGRLAEALSYPPVIIPEITEAVALMLFFLYLGFPLGMVSVIIGHTAFNVAYAYIVLRAGRGETRRLELAARTLGASPLAAFTRVTLPLLAPTIGAALAITFLMSFTDFTKTLFTAGAGLRTLTVLLWTRARRPGLNPYTSQPYLAAVTSVMIVLSVSILVLYLVYQARRERGLAQEGR